MNTPRRHQSQNVVIPRSSDDFNPGHVSPDGNGSPGTVPSAGSSTDQLIREMSAQFTGVTDQLAHLSRNFVDVQRQFSELSFGQLPFHQWKLKVSCRSGTCLWPQAQSAQELKNIHHQVPLPAWLGPISHHQFKNTEHRIPVTPCLILGTTKVMNSKEAQFWVKFPCGQNKDTTEKFLPHSFTYSTFNPLAVKKSADIFARQDLGTNVKLGNSCLSFGRLTLNSSVNASVSWKERLHCQWSTGKMPVSGLQTKN